MFLFFLYQKFISKFEISQGDQGIKGEVGQKGAIGPDGNYKLKVNIKQDLN